MFVAQQMVPGVARATFGTVRCGLFLRAKVRNERCRQGRLQCPGPCWYHSLRNKKAHKFIEISYLLLGYFWGLEAPLEAPRERSRKKVSKRLPRGAVGVQKSTHFGAKNEIGSLPKKHRFSNTKLQKIVRNLKIPEMRFSKYCMGMLHVNKEVKYNRFKPKLLQINKILNQV